MTIIDAAAGEAISYPKPMTLFVSTMGVAKDGRLTVGDRAALSIQSRLHSKSGREVGRSLGERNIPIMTMNSVVQAGCLRRSIGSTRSSTARSAAAHPSATWS